MARKAVTDDFKVFPERLSELMKERNVTQEELAHELGIKRQTVSLYKNGQSTPDAAKLKNISLFFGVSSDWLLGLSNIRLTCDNEETPTSLGLSNDFVHFLGFAKRNCTNEEFNFLHSVLSSKYFFDSIKAIVRLCNVKIPSTSLPNGTEGCALFHRVKDLDDRILHETSGHYTVCSVDTAVDGLIFRAQSSFASAIEHCYYNKGTQDH